MAQGSWDPEAAAADPGCQSPDALVPCCNNNCRFLGCAATMNLCSKCYSELILKEGSLFSEKPMAEPANSSADMIGAPTERSLDKSMLCPKEELLKVDAAAETDLHEPIPSPLSLSPPIESVSSLPLSPPAPQQTVNRCLACRKRVGLRGFKCRCGDLFCALHRYSEKHDCSYDYKAAGRVAIAKQNPIVKASKVEKI